ncbi:MAG: type II toxin-antitoxin system RelE/ParE family toxin [Rickettsiales bacterium]
MIIRKIRHKGLRLIYQADDARGVPAASSAKIKRVLSALEYADNIEQVATLPGWKLHQLKGSRCGEYSITITGNWRITFSIEENSIINLDFEDYH